jgi:hypothetical protein
MIGIVLCLIALVVTYSLAARSLGAGFVALLSVGYAYGLVRARMNDVGSHFLFDVALLGLYLGGFSRPTSEAMKLRSRTAAAWAAVLMAWPFVCMGYSPVLGSSQPLLVQLVGIRDSLMMLPCLILGARLTREDTDLLAPGLAVLNLAALGVAALEYFVGVETIVPQTAGSALIYQSMDINTAGGVFYRIPSTFVSSHVYGGTAALSVPFIAHGLESGRNVRILSWAGIGAAAIGIFLCGARLPVVMMGIATAYVIGSLRMRLSTVFAFALAGGIVAYFVLNFERFQRFTTLSDTNMVRERIGMSVSMSFFDILAIYPFGAGLASAFGTNIPYFLQDTPGIHAQIGLESEYGRILLEQGLVGVVLWACFALFTTFRRQQIQDVSPTARAYMQAIVGLTWASGLLGTGLLSAVPSAVLVVVAAGIRLATPVATTAPQTLRFVAPRRAVARNVARVGSLAAGRTSR